jgi:hypothetical protein
MSTALVIALRESCGYLQDDGWHQTARLMILAAQEIERLNERLRELEAHASRLEPPHADTAQRVVPLAIAARRRR